MEQRDRQALEDIIGVLDRALEFPIPDAQTLEDTTYLQDAVIRCLEVLGEARSLRSLSRTPEAKDLLASGGDWLGCCGGDKDIVSTLKGGFRTGRRVPRLGAQVAARRRPAPFWWIPPRSAGVCG